MARLVTNSLARFRWAGNAAMVFAGIALLAGCTTTSSTPAPVAFSPQANPAAARAYAATTNEPYKVD